MKKCIKGLSFIVVLFSALLFIFNVKAANATISISGSSTAVVGNTITVTVTLSSSTSLGSWDFTVGYDTSKLRLTYSDAESSQRAVGYVSRAGQTSKSYTFKFKTLSKGTANIYINSAEVYDFNENKMSVSKGTKSITLKTQQEIQASYSKNNYLKDLSVDGYEISPKFDKDTLEYSVELDSTIEKINISAIVEDKTANVSGIGKKELIEGENVIDIIVTAQNGNTRKYVLKANVKEQNPINVEINGKKYTVVKRKKVLTIPDNFTETTVVINNEEIPAFYNEITKYTVVGLKDEEGKIDLFLYDLNSGKYTLYQELNFNSNKLFLLDVPNNIPEGLKKVKITINDKKIDSYKFDYSDIYYIIYGMNLNTGNKDFYMYDSEEHTIQRYDTTMLDKVTQEKDKYLTIVIVLSCVCFLTMLFLLIEVNKYHKKNEV